MTYLLIMVIAGVDYNTDARFNSMEECLAEGLRLKKEAVYEGEITAKCVGLDENE